MGHLVAVWMYVYTSRIQQRRNICCQAITYVMVMACVSGVEIEKKCLRVCSLEMMYVSCGVLKIMCKIVKSQAISLACNWLMFSCISLSA